MYWNIKTLKRQLLNDFFWYCCRLILCFVKDPKPVNSKKPNAKKKRAVKQPGIFDFTATQTWFEGFVDFHNNNNNNNNNNNLF